MEKLLILRDKVKEIYANESTIVDKIITFLFALITFLLINGNIGFMKIAASPLVSIGLAIICAFLPRSVILIFSTGLILLHLYSLSGAILIVTAMLFLIMYIFYFRFSPKHALFVILTPIAFFLKIPYIIPIAFGIVATPVAAIPMSCGIIGYYILIYVKRAATTVEAGSAGLMKNITTYSKQVFQNQEMILFIIGFAICLILVYTIRHMAINYAWKVAMIVGTLINIVVLAVGDIVFHLSISFGGLLLGNGIALGICMILEFFLFSVDYSRRENLEFEDDEYVYYVKAIPKVAVTAAKKTVKKINERQETEILDAQAIKEQQKSKEEIDDKTRVLSSQGTKEKNEDEINRMLFTQSIEKELELKK